MRSTLSRVDDYQPHLPDRPPPPGKPLQTGFEAGRKDRTRLSDEAKQRVLEKMHSVDEARARAAEDSRTAYVG
jgi:hypothetical protein